MKKYQKFVTKWRENRPGKYNAGRFFGGGATVALLLIGMGQSVRADKTGPKTDSFLANALTARTANDWSSVIVRIDGDCTPDREAQLKACGASIQSRLPLIHSVTVRIPNSALNKLSALPFVKHLSSNAIVRKYDGFTTGSTGTAAAWAAPYKLDGTNIGVAILDSGIHEQHPDVCKYIPGLKGKLTALGDRVAVSVNFVDASNDPAPAVGPRPSLQTWLTDHDLIAPTGSGDDRCGHGTHVAGIIAGNAAQSSSAANTQNYYGIAPKASLINVRVLNANGQSDVSTVVAGITWVVNSVKNNNPYNIRVLNLSMGHPVGDAAANDPLCQAVEAAWQAGIVVVCAAGNDGRVNDAMPNPPVPDNEGYGAAYGSIDSPGNDPYVITVGAMKSVDGQHPHDAVATYSSRGPSRLDLTLKPDIVAPGNHIVSLNVPGSYLDLNFNAQTNVLNSEYVKNGNSSASRDYIRLSGTSMATPVVSGAIALMLQASPALTPDTVKARLMFSADKWADATGMGNPCTYGAGFLNIPAALNSRIVPTQPALSPSLTIDDQGNVTINMDRALWGTRAIWGTDVTHLRAIWGTRAIWGVSTNQLNANRALWGTNVWSDRAVWGVTTTQSDLSTKVIQGEK